MKIKKVKHPYHSSHHVTNHQKIERFFRHRFFLSVILFIMGLSFVKYQTKMVAVLTDIHFGDDIEILVDKTHHYETIRMPVEYGSTRINSISGE